MTIEIPFNIEQRVWIRELECWGIVTRIAIDRRGLAYLVAWFFDGRRHEEYLYPQELVPSNSGDSLTSRKK